MEPTNFLDVLVARFRDRWETEPQYRAMMSGVIGLVTVFGLCSCMLLASLAANSTLNSFGFGASGVGAVGQQNGGGGGLLGVPTFPTNPIPSWTVQNTPVSVVAPTSSASAPTPTELPTPTTITIGTPCFFSCGGGGGGGHVTYTTSWSPYNWGQCAAGGACTFSVHTSAPNVGVYIAIVFCNNAHIIAPPGQTNGNGDWSYTFTGPGAGPHSDVDVQVQGAAELHFNPPCT